MQTQSNSSGKLATATRITATTTKNPHTKVSPMVRYRQKPPITQRSQRSKLQLNDTIANTQRNNSRRRSSMFDDGGRERERERHSVQENIPFKTHPQKTATTLNNDPPRTTVRTTNGYLFYIARTLRRIIVFFFIFALAHAKAQRRGEKDTNTKQAKPLSKSKLLSPKMVCLHSTSARFTCTSCAKFYFLFMRL